MKGYISVQIAEAKRVMSAMLADEALLSTLEAASGACIGSLQRGGKILLAGNGGSAADAQHIAGELVSRFAFDRPGLPAIALTTDSSILTAIGNDYGYEKLFSRQVQAHGNKGDVFIGYSTSGKSPNILPGYLFWVLLPLHVLLNLVTILWFAARGQSGVILRAKRDALQGLPKMWRKRREIQKNRVATIGQIWRVLDKQLFRK